MKRLVQFFLLGIVLIVLGLVHGRPLGMVAEPLLEKAMVRAFDMPVHIQGTRVFLWPLQLSVEKLEILNPPGFKRRDHFTAQGIDLLLDAKVLKNKFIRIREAHFKKVVFAIESYMTPQGSRTNVKHWYHNMGLDEDTPPPPPRAMPDPDNVGENAWRVRIDRLDMEDGMIIFDDRRPPEARWIFEHIKGYWTGFDFLSNYVSPVFTETIQVEATFGENPPARFKGGGRCQFADGDNFDVQAEISGGSVAEYEFLLAWIPGEVTSGTFDLTSHLLCVENDLKSEHRLTLKDMRFTSPTTAQKLLKYPFGAVQFLLSNEKTVELNIKVDGYIGDPKFRMLSAFTNAFQKALVDKTTAGLKGTVKLAVDTPRQVTNGLTKIGEILTGPFTPKDKANAASNGGTKSA